MPPGGDEGVVGENPGFFHPEEGLKELNRRVRAGKGGKVEEGKGKGEGQVIPANGEPVFVVENLPQKPLRGEGGLAWVVVGF